MRWLFHGAVLSLSSLSEAEPFSFSDEVEVKVFKSLRFAKKPKGFLEAGKAVPNGGGRKRERGFRPGI
jgi:hypothetical protein